MIIGTSIDHRPAEAERTAVHTLVTLHTHAHLPSTLTAGEHCRLNVSSVHTRNSYASTNGMSLSCTRPSLVAAPPAVGCRQSSRRSADTAPERTYTMAQ
jgi:hypothetical protein